MSSLMCSYRKTLLYSNHKEVEKGGSIDIDTPEANSCDKLLPSGKTRKRICNAVKNENRSLTVFMRCGIL